MIVGQRLMNLWIKIWLNAKSGRITKPLIRPFLFLSFYDHLFFIKLVFVYDMKEVGSVL